MKPTKSSILTWNNINCAIYFLLIALWAYNFNAHRWAWENRFAYVSIYTLPFIIVYCFVDFRFEKYIYCDSSTEETEPYYRLSTHIIRGFIMAHDIVFIVLISVFVIFAQFFEFFVNKTHILAFVFLFAKLRTLSCKLLLKTTTNGLIWHLQHSFSFHLVLDFVYG